MGKTVESASDWHVVQEELHPLVPVARVDVPGVVLLLVVVCLVGDVDDLVEQAGAQFGVVGGLLGGLVSLHLSAANETLLHYALGGLLHRSEQLGLLLLSQLAVKFAASLILTLAKLAVL